MKHKNIYAVLIIISFIFKAESQNLNKEISNNGQTPYLIGQIDKGGLQGENYASWFTKNYEDYSTNQTVINTISSELQNYTITLFMGTWCGDSKKEVPRLYKVLEAANFPMHQLTVIAVSREANMYKQSPQHEEAGLNIHRVPTVIFYKNGKEINRIIEHPIDSFEEDIKQIITKNKYTSNYQIVSVVDAILKKKGIKGLHRKQTKLLKQFSGKVPNMYQLNTYGRILYGTDKIDEAIAVFTFNTKLFANEPGTYMSLANTLGISKKQTEAIKVLEDAIKLFPENEDLKENLEVIKSN